MYPKRDYSLTYIGKDSKYCSVGCLHVCLNPLMPYPNAISNAFANKLEC